MKIRNGFVSNSSSSSFLVNFKELNGNILLTNEEIKLLKKCHFKPTEIENVSDLYYSQNKYNRNKPQRMISKANTVAFSKNIICNQDFIISFLLSNNIPFSCLCAHGTEWVFYKRNANTFLRITDIGKYFELYNKVPIEKCLPEQVDVQQFLKDNPCNDDVFKVF